MPLSLNIKRFKCFDELRLRIENLTVLTGKNSVGKSSITQAIRLLREVAISSSDPVQIHLNGSGFQLGIYDEILKRNRIEKSSDSIELGLSNQTDESSLITLTPAEDSEECEYINARFSDIPLLSNHSPRFFTYLSAERYGPRLRQEITDGHRSIDVGVGIKGEFSAEVLANSQTTRIDERLIYPIDNSLSLLSVNLEKWMSSIVGDIRIRALRPPRLAMPMLEFIKHGTESEWQFPTNFGFGVSYTLPIVLAGLLLEENGFLIVDSPEAHLHPAAQTSLAQFLAHVAASGRYVIIETHSDHIVDGFRLAIANKSHPISADNCVFHYLDQSENGSVAHHDLSPRPNGTLPKWPKGFFDQAGTNLRNLAMLSK